MSNYGLGSLPSPPDSRDYPLTKAPNYKLAPTVFPSSYMLSGGVPEVLDQNGYPRCVAYSTTGVKLFQEHLQTGKWLYDATTADKLYAQCKLQDGIPDSDGTYPRVALDVAVKSGLVATNGHRYLMASYYNLLVAGDLLTNIKQTLVFYNRPVLFALHWFNNWFTLNKDFTVPNPNGTIAGDHEMWIWGYVDGVSGTLLRIENSWGTGFGNAGRFYMPFKYLALPTSGLSDCWGTIDR